MTRTLPTTGRGRLRAGLVALATASVLAGGTTASAAAPAPPTPAESSATTATAAVRIPNRALLHENDLPTPAFFDPWGRAFTEYDTHDQGVNHVCASTSLRALGALRVKTRWFDGEAPEGEEAQGGQQVVAVFRDAATARTAHARITRRIDRCEAMPDVAEGMITRRTATFRDPRARGSVWYAGFPTYPEGTYHHTHLGVVRSGRALGVVNVSHEGRKTFDVRGLLPATRTAGQRLARAFG